MNLLIIKNLCEQREGGIKRLAEDIKMSEQNLHRCINLNKIQAGELEKIAHIFNVPIGYFFDNTNASQSIANGNGSAASVYGNATVGAISDKEKELEHLKVLLKEKDKIITEKERLIQVLMNK